MAEAAGTLDSSVQPPRLWTEMQGPQLYSYLVTGGAPLLAEEFTADILACAYHVVSTQCILVE